MNNILITLKKELKLIIRDKKSLLMMAITPLFIPIFVILMSYIYEELTVNKDDKTYQIGVNYELSSTERELLSDEVKYAVYSSSKELEEAYNSNKILAYIVKDNNSYNIYANIQSEDGSMVTSLITNYLDNYNNYLGQSYLVNNNIDLSKVYNNLNYNVTEIKGESIFGNQIILMAITFTIMAITLSCIYTSTDTTAGEKERGTLETILTFPISRKELIFGKYLAISISGIVTLLIGVLLSILSLFKLFRKGELVYEGSALNEAVVRASVSVVKLEAFSDGREVTAFSGDGMIASTPTGSTAYSMAAGGPIVEPCADCIILTPICTFRLAARSYVLKADREVSIRTVEQGDKEVFLSVDGVAVPFLDGDELVVARSDKTLLMARVKDRSFFDIVFEKLVDK